MVASLTPMFSYLTEQGYHAVFHADCIEIVPIEEWVNYAHPKGCELLVLPSQVILAG